MKLVIVESPAKAKTINKYLGNDFKVLASFGHVRDLPSKNGSVIPEKNFLMKYVISTKTEKHINIITNYAKKASEIYLATDPDREGESIAWHIIEVLKEKKIIKDNFKRITFNEITQKAILEAIKKPRSINEDLVNAQQARRALDYLVGFTLSPVLWRKIPKCRSAGRVQSVALRLICDREEEIEKFISQEYWDINLDMLNSKNEKFISKLTTENGKKLTKFSIPNQELANKIKKQIEGKNFSVIKIEKKKQKKNPFAPFITSSLQQEAYKKLGFSTKKTMIIAQKLYEGLNIDDTTIGLITYMRTDGVSLSEEAISSIRSAIKTIYGEKYLPKNPKKYKKQVKNAQEAHEAIRPTNINLLPEELINKIDADQQKLYELIWRRTIMSQMESAIINIIEATFSSEDKLFIAKAHGSTVFFDGFNKANKENYSKIKNEQTQSKELAYLFESEQVKIKNINTLQHFTEPPARYSEASLVKKLEELGIGRPSTYATIISVLQDRKYVINNTNRFFPSNLGRLLTLFLTGFFKKYIEYNFTATLEEDLDKIALGKMKWISLLNDFWIGFSTNINDVQNKTITEVIQYIEEQLNDYLFNNNKSQNDYISSKNCSKCKEGVLKLKISKFGVFLACNNYPDCTFKQDNIFNKEPNNDVEPYEKDILLGNDEENNQIWLKKGMYGWYVQKGEDTISTKNKVKKAKRITIPKSINPKTINLLTALNLLKMPFSLGKDTSTNTDIILAIGRYGPYLKHNNLCTSIPKDQDLFSITINEAIKIIKTREKIKSTNKKKVLIANK